jgi:hypothetical protein
MAAPAATQQRVFAQRTLEYFTRIARWFTQPQQMRPLVVDCCLPVAVKLLTVDSAVLDCCVPCPGLQGLKWLSVSSFKGQQRVDLRNYFVVSRQAAHADLQLSWACWQSCWCSRCCWSVQQPSCCSEFVTGAVAHAPAFSQPPPRPCPLCLPRTSKPALLRPPRRVSASASLTGPPCRPSSLLSTRPWMTAMTPLWLSCPATGGQQCQCSGAARAHTPAPVLVTQPYHTALQE